MASNACHQSGYKNGTGTFNVYLDSDSTGREVRASCIRQDEADSTVDWVLKNFCFVVLFFSSVRGELTECC